MTARKKAYYRKAKTRGGPQPTLKAIVDEAKTHMAKRATKRRKYANPSLRLCCKLGSLVIHIEEWLSPYGHDLDFEALKSLLTDQDVKDWIAEMSKAGLVPRKRQ